MKKLGKVLLVVLAGTVLCGGGAIGGGYALDPVIELQTSSVLDGSPQEIQRQLDSLEGVVDWWDTVAEDIAGGDQWKVVHVGGPTQGPGLELDFQVNGESFEHWTLISSEPGKVVWEVDFGIFKTERTLSFVASGSGTEMTWHERGTMESPLLRWFRFMPTTSLLENFENAMEGLDASVQ